MELIDFLDPVELEKPDEYYLKSQDLFSKNITINTENTNLNNLSSFNIAILGVPEDRNSFNKGAALSPTAIRSELYKLMSTEGRQKIIDIGNIKAGNTYTDTYIALKEVILILLGNNLNILVIGGTQELTLPIFLAFENYQQKINLVTIDSRIDSNKDALELNSDSYLLEILLKKKKLFKYVNVGHQAHFTEKRDLELLNKLFHEAVRLGEIRTDIKKIEPVLRDADIVSFDMSAVRHSDSPGYYRASPNGFNAEEACQIARYSGMSDLARVFGVFEANARLDSNNHTAALVAQMLWYYIDGMENRFTETPDSENNNFKTFIVSHDDLDYDMTFFRSMLSDRWWLEVPNIKNNLSVVIACSHDDYVTACNHEVPEIWWKTFQKLE
ncbi:MAG: formimidoylglutamase [Bacteroidales bacterium]|nr:formimidoylglutamase [Bacteroidales bacterium]MBN2817652.1 formimidoylglutamase [Bacteroidales bacterium]